METRYAEFEYIPSGRIFNGSDITDVTSVKGLQFLQVVPLEPGPIRHPPFFRSEILAIQIKTQLYHLVNLFLESLLVGPYLSDYFISVETENELGLVADCIVACDLRGGVSIDFDDFQEAVAGCNLSHLWVSDRALRVPARPEVDKRVHVLVLQ